MKRKSWTNLFHTYHLRPKFFKYAWQRITRGYADCDCWEIKSYLSEIIPGMLQHLRDNHMGSPCFDVDYIHSLSEEDLEKDNQQWNKILDDMIHCWREADDETCSMKNEYDDEFDRATEEYNGKYGVLGEKLRTPEEVENDEKYGVQTTHLIFQHQDFKDISNKWFDREQEIDNYKHKMQDKALDYLKEYFDNLWD
jgi:hypothetical protein